MLSRMEHRGGTGFDIKSGDGAGILLQMPHEFFLQNCSKDGIELPAFGEYGAVQKVLLILVWGLDI